MPDTTGSKNGRARLSEYDVGRMRFYWLTGKYTYEEMGRMFGVSRETARRAIKGETWRHVP